MRDHLLHMRYKCSLLCMCVGELKLQKQTHNIIFNWNRLDLVLVFNKVHKYNYIIKPDNNGWRVLKLNTVQFGWKILNHNYSNLEQAISARPLIRKYWLYEVDLAWMDST